MFPQIRTKLIANFFLQFSNQYDSYGINYVGIILDIIVRWNKRRWVDQFFSPLYDDFSFCNFVVPVSRTKWNFVRDSFHHFVCKAESSAIVRKNSICGLVSMYCGKVRAIVIDYFSCNPIAKPNVQCDTRYRRPFDCRFFSEKSRLDRTAGASNRDPMCKMAFPYVTVKYIYIVYIYKSIVTRGTCLFFNFFFSPLLVFLRD